MCRILRVVVAFIFVVGLSGTYVSKSMWACGEGAG